MPKMVRARGEYGLTCGVSISKLRARTALATRCLSHFLIEGDSPGCRRDEPGGRCTLRELLVEPRDPGCDAFDLREEDPHP